MASNKLACPLKKGKSWRLEIENVKRFIKVRTIWCDKTD